MTRTATHPSGRGRPFRVQIFIGTRPEFIKLAPLTERLRRQAPDLEVSCVHTGQHATLGRDTGRHFGVGPILRLPPPVASDAAPNLSSTHRGLLRSIEAALLDFAPDLVLLQGDTLTAMSAAQCAYHHRIPVGHVEAGLRTHRFDQPWPEEILRVTISRLAAWHYAPTETARANLLAEGVEPTRILVTGNTVVDAFRAMSLPEPDPSTGNDRLRILLTLHRRENFGPPQDRIASALRTFLQRHPDRVDLLALSHPNPESGRHLPRLRDLPNVTILDPLPYPEFIRVMRGCRLIASDSGGIQEEAPLLGIPVLVLRDATERPELLTSGMGTMPGSDPTRILSALESWLLDPAPRPAADLFGDGRASERITSHILTLAG